ncbi:MAG TPA: hypothetical protein VGZ03_01325 [Acidimicrobiales bacterium]|jgi:hypothetical protein|nr:hypothetical protein [Acidimicrobiales bacterium]
MAATRPGGDAASVPRDVLVTSSSRPGSTPPTSTPDGRWFWDGEGWIEARPRTRWPASSRPPLFGWLASIVALWLLTWCHPYPWSATQIDLSIAVFALASLSTLVFGGVLATHGHERLIRRAAFVGVVVLCASSILAIGIAAAVSVGIVELVPAIAATMLFGSIVIIALGAVGFSYLALLLWSGAKLAAHLPPRRHRAT